MIFENPKDIIGFYSIPSASLINKNLIFISLVKIINKSKKT